MMQVWAFMAGIPRELSLDYEVNFKGHTDKRIREL